MIGIMKNLRKKKLIIILILFTLVAISAFTLFKLVEIRTAGRVIDDNSGSENETADDPDEGSQYITVTLSGDSMLPTFEDGEEILVDPTNKYPKFHDFIGFEYDGDSYFKRVIGMPGDTIRIEDGDVYINGEEEEFLTDLYVGKVFIGEVTLAEDEYYVLGDNREHSYDSRAFGPVKRDWIQGVFIRKIVEEE